MADLVVRRLGTREEVSRVTVTSRTQRHVERVMMGMLGNMDTDKFYVDDSEFDAIWQKQEAPNVE